MSKIKWDGGTLLAPVPPVMVSCGSMEKPNIVTVAWTGIINSTPPKTYISLRPQRYSHDIIKERGEFVINLTNASLVRNADYCGMVSGKNVDKFAKCKLEALPAPELKDCPMIAQSPLSLSCKVSDIIPMGTHDMFIADIVSVSVEDSLVEGEGRGKMHLDKAGLVAYSHGEYFALGKKLGTFGFSMAKKRPKNPQKKK